MSKKIMTEAEVQLLRMSPHVESVSPRAVMFTPAFKQLLYREMMAGGNIRELLEKHGISTAALGTTRINGLVEKLRQVAGREEGFQNLRHTARKRQPQDSEESLQKRIRQLETQLAYTRQEVEFLKKMQQVDMEARRSWESKHQPK